MDCIIFAESRTIMLIGVVLRMFPCRALRAVFAFCLRRDDRPVAVICQAEYCTKRLKMCGIFF